MVCFNSHSNISSFLVISTYVLYLTSNWMPLLAENIAVWFLSFFVDPVPPTSCLISMVYMELSWTHILQLRGNVLKMSWALMTGDIGQFYCFFTCFLSTCPISYESKDVEAVHKWIYIQVIRSSISSLRKRDKNKKKKDYQKRYGICIFYLDSKWITPADVFDLCLVSCCGGQQTENTPEEPLCPLLPVKCSWG